MLIVSDKFNLKSKVFQLNKNVLYLRTVRLCLV